MIDVKNYVYSFRSVSAPKVNVSLNTVTKAQLTAAITVYGNEVTTYTNNLNLIVNNKEYVVDRFKKDVLADVGFATINKATNKYTENLYAGKYWNKAVAGLDLTKESGLRNALENITSLYQLFLNNSNEKFSFEVKTTVDYDTKAIEVLGDYYYLNNPNAFDNKRIYSSGDGYTISYDAGQWVLADSEEALMATCENIDDPEWIIPEEVVDESSSSEESSENESSSSSESEPVVEQNESSSSSEEPSEPVEPEESSSSEEPVEPAPEEPVEESSSSESTPEEPPVIEESSSSEESTEPEGE